MERIICSLALESSLKNFLTGFILLLRPHHKRRRELGLCQYVKRVKKCLCAFTRLGQLIIADCPRGLVLLMKVISGELKSLFGGSINKYSPPCGRGRGKSPNVLSV